MPKPESLDNLLTKGIKFRFFKGQKAWNKGIKMSQAFREKCKETHITTGSTSENKIARMSIDFKDWRMQVFERDEYTCRGCYRMGGRLVPHHIFSFTKYVKDRYNVDNGITLCENCHLEFHKTYGFKNFISDNIILMLWKKELLTA